MRAKNEGFTVIELLMVSAIAGIMLAIGVPAFMTLINKNRVAEELNALVSSLQFARAEAIKEGQTTTVCASTNGTSCNITTGIWNTGWIVFSDPNGNGTVDTGEKVRKIQQNFGGADTLTASSSRSTISFSRDGFATGLTGTVQLTLHTTPVVATSTKCLTINVVGLQSTQTPDTSSACL